MPDPDPTEARAAMGRALGRLPSGLFILTARAGATSLGMLASWVQQAGFEPPCLTVAVRRDRPTADAIAATGRFALSQIAAGQKRLLSHFARGFPAGADAFAGLDVRDGAQGGPVLADALAFLDCEVAGKIEGGDHRVWLAKVVGGGMLRDDTEPMIHVRHNGFHY